MGFPKHGSSRRWTRKNESEKNTVSPLISHCKISADISVNLRLDDAHSSDEISEAHVRSESEPIETPRSLQSIESELDEWPPWLPAFTYGEECTLDQEIKYLFELLQLTDAEHRRRQRTATKVTTAITEKWPTAKVLLYGSYPCGLCLPHGDIDLTICGIPLSPNEGLQGAKDVLELAGFWCHPILSARVPVLKLLDKVTGIQVDVTWAETDSPVVSEVVSLINNLLAGYPSARPLILLIKSLLQQHNLQEPRDGGLGSLAVTVLVLAYLKCHVGNLSSEGSTPSPLPSFHTKCHCSDPSNLGDLLVDFLCFYGHHFDTLHYYVSVSQECPFIHLTTAGRPHDVVYFDSTGMHSVLVIQDPTIPSNNLSALCKEWGSIFKLFQTCFSSLCNALHTHVPHRLNSILAALEPLQERRLLKDREPLWQQRAATQSSPPSESPVQPQLPLLPIWNGTCEALESTLTAFPVRVPTLSGEQRAFHVGQLWNSLSFSERQALQCGMLPACVGGEVMWTHI